MAQKRMFTMKICDSDAFLDMPLSTQCLYFHLCMRADDDGFIGNPKRIQRLVGASEDDLKLLIAKRFVLTFEDGVIVIKHWKMHNYIQTDRYTPTAYLEERSMLTVKKNKAYSLNVNKSDTKCIQSVSTDIGLDIGLDIDKDLDIDIDIDLDKEKGKKENKRDKEPAVYFPNDEKLNKTFLGFIQMRKSIKAKMTDRAIELMIKKINKHDNDTAIAMMEQSIMNGWKDIYPLKDQKNNIKSVLEEWGND